MDQHAAEQGKQRLNHVRSLAEQNGKGVVSPQHPTRPDRRWSSMYKALLPECAWLAHYLFCFHYVAGRQ